MTTPMKEPVLRLDDVRITYKTQAKTIQAVSGATLCVDPGEAVGIVGESGSGKSTLAKSVLGLLPSRIAKVSGGRIHIMGEDVTHLPEANWSRLRGNPISMVFQDPLSALNPVMRIGKQIAESVRRHDGNVDIDARVQELLRLVKLPERVARAYPHELSGGMRQRALIAVALGCRPKLLVADEPTTALDVTTQAEILALLTDLRKRLGMSMLYISHDLGTVSSFCSRIYVMYGGKTVETGPSDTVFSAPAHPYTQGLLQAALAEKDENGRFTTISGSVPDLSLNIPGCPFAPRCTRNSEICDQTMPDALPTANEDHIVRCWHPISRATNTLAQSIEADVEKGTVNG